MGKQGGWVSNHNHSIENRAALLIANIWSKSEYEQVVETPHLLLRQLVEDYLQKE